MRVFFVGSTLLICAIVLLPSPGSAQYDPAPERSERFPWPDGGIRVDTVGSVAELVTERRRSSRDPEPER